jgi:hypothetical protein
MSHTDLSVDEARRLHATGMTTLDIGLRFGCSRTTVRVRIAGNDPKVRGKLRNYECRQPLGARQQATDQQSAVVTRFLSGMMPSPGLYWYPATAAEYAALVRLGDVDHGG